MGSQLPNGRIDSSATHTMVGTDARESKVGHQRECSDHPNMAHSIGNLYVVLYQGNTGEERRRIKRDSDANITITRSTNSIRTSPTDTHNTLLYG